jgi:L-alanine-DL-glutamate epimerase-like enolase superfamily enzyme
MRIVELTTYRPAVQPNACILALRADDGAVGLGETFWGSPAVEAYLHETASPVLAALADPTPAAAAFALRPYTGFGGSGAEIRGNSAIDIALWDLLGHASGQPVARLLGGPVAPSIRVYNTCAGYGYIASEGRQSTSNWGLPAGGPDQRPYEDLEAFLHRPAELARSLLDEGYTAMKVWPFDGAAVDSRGHDIRTADLREAVGILEAIRAEAGEAMDILVELHSLWSLKAATRIVRALEDVHPFWIEDPIRADAVDAYRRLRERTTLPIAVGEALAGARAFKPLLDAGALDVAIVDPGWTGGISEAVRIATLADAHGVSFAPHDCTGPVSFAVCVNVVASQANGLVAESVRAFQASWYPQVVDGLPVIRDGRVAPSERPGLGVTLRVDFVTRPDTITRTTLLAP